MTTKQRRFVEEYTVDFNATAAAMRAGYSKKTARSIGSENLTKPDIKAAIEDRLDELSMTAAEATKRLTDWGRGSVAPFLRITDDGEVLIDLRTADAQAALHLIKKLEQKEIVLQSRDDGDEVLKRTFKIELHDAKDAVKEIAKIRGLLGPKGTEDDPQHVAVAWRVINGGADGS